MSPQHLNKLVDILALSQKRCAHPIQVIAKYTVTQNFIGRPINGYTPGLTELLLLSKVAAESLCRVQNKLVSEYQVGLLVLDAYRPKRAVMDFVAWSKQPAANHYELERKEKHYPHIEKTQLFDLGYVAEDSQHCYGHTVDLVLVDLTGKPLNMGARFDFMDPISHITVQESEIGAEAFKNRELLINTMTEFGFIPYEKEFWHFSHSEKEILEPMDIEITPQLKGLNAG